MDILYLLTSDLESPYGLGRCYPMARELVNRGHQVTIAALHGNLSTVSEKIVVRDGVNIKYVAQMHVLKRGNQKEYFSSTKLLSTVTSATLKLCEVALNSKADIIHIGKPQPMNGFAGLISKYLRGKSLYLDCDDYEAASGRFGTRWQKSSVELFEKWMPRQAKVITVNTHFMQKKLISWGISESKIHYLPNGVDMTRFAPTNKIEVDNLVERLNLTGKQVVCYIGSMGLASHSVDLLIKAFVKVNKQLPDSRLLLVGGGEDYNRLQRLTQQLGIEKATKFCGRVHPTEVPLYYRLSDVSVDPVYNNDAARGRSPLKLFESWACGVPFVTGDVGDRRSLLGEPPAGILVEPGSSDALSKAIIDLLLDRDHANEARRRGEQRVEGYSWDKLVQRIEQIYLTTLDKEM